MKNYNSKEIKEFRKISNQKWSGIILRCLISLIFTIALAFCINQASHNLNHNIDGETTLDFCKAHYRNDSFLSTMVGDDPAEPKVCDSAQWRTGWAQYCNDTCFENYERCLKENATEEQIRFSSECHWMGRDYIILLTGVLSRFIIIAGIGIIIAVIYSKIKADKMVRQMNIIK